MIVEGVRSYKGGPAAARRHLLFIDRELEKEQTPEKREWLVTKRDIARSYLSNHCRRCGKRLTSQVSLERGYGPECAAHFEAAS